MKKKKDSKLTSWLTLEFHPSEETDEVVVKGAWDDWKGSTMRKKKNGTFYIRKKFPVGDWECGFECNQSLWQINPNFKTTSSPFGSLNNIISVSQ